MTEDTRLLMAWVQKSHMSMWPICKQSLAQNVLGRQGEGVDHKMLGVAAGRALQGFPMGLLKRFCDTAQLRALEDGDGPLYWRFYRFNGCVVSDKSMATFLQCLHEAGYSYRASGALDRAVLLHQRGDAELAVLNHLVVLLRAKPVALEALIGLRGPLLAAIRSTEAARNFDKSNLFCALCSQLKLMAYCGAVYLRIDEEPDEMPASPAQAALAQTPPAKITRLERQQTILEQAAELSIETAIFAGFPWLGGNATHLGKSELQQLALVEHLLTLAC